MHKLMWQGITCTCDFGVTLNPEHHYSDCPWRAKWLMDRLSTVIYEKPYVTLSGIDELEAIHRELNEPPKPAEQEVARPKEETLRDRRTNQLKTWTF